MKFDYSEYGAHAKYEEWDLVFDTEGKGGEAAEEQKELILECKEHCTNLNTLVSTEMLKFQLKKGSVDMSRFSSSASDARCKPIVPDAVSRRGLQFVDYSVASGV